MGCQGSRHRDEPSVSMSQLGRKSTILALRVGESVMHIVDPDAEVSGLPITQKRALSLIGNKLDLSWAEFHSQFGYKEGYHPFIQVISKKKNLLSAHFSAEPLTSKRGALYQNALDNELFMKHMEDVRLVISYVIHDANTASSASVADTTYALRRLGALHAEKGVSIKTMRTFKPSFLYALNSNQPEMSKEVKESWHKLITFISSQMNVGMQDREIGIKGKGLQNSRSQESLGESSCWPCGYHEAGARNDGTGVPSTTTHGSDDADKTRSMGGSISRD